MFSGAWLEEGGGGFATTQRLPQLKRDLNLRSDRLLAWLDRDACVSSCLAAFSFEERHWRLHPNGFGDIQDLAYAGAGCLCHRLRASTGIAQRLVTRLLF